MNTMIRIGHLSDVHLNQVPKPNLTQLLSKRLIGYINWRINRSRLMSRERLSTLVADLRDRTPDHIAVTGDLTNIALPGEFENARIWLQSLGTGEDVTVIPGNHDAYVPFASRRYRRLWAPWMSDGFSPNDGPARFPFLRTIGQVALIGLSTAVPTLPFMATGRLGTDQMLKLKTILQDTGNEGLFRIILIHHPPRRYDVLHKYRRLTDAAGFRSLIRRTGAELIIHGHDHVATSESIPGNQEPVPVIGAASAAGPPCDGAEAGGYTLHEIDRSEEGYTLTVIHRGFDGSGAIVEKSRRRFAISGPQTRHR